MATKKEAAKRFHGVKGKDRAALMEAALVEFIQQSGYHVSGMPIGDIASCPAWKCFGAGFGKLSGFISSRPCFQISGGLVKLQLSPKGKGKGNDKVNKKDSAEWDEEGKILIGRLKKWFPKDSHSFGYIECLDDIVVPPKNDLFQKDKMA